MAPKIKNLSRLSSFEKLFPYFFTFALSFSLADLGIQKFRPTMLPSEPPPKMPTKIKKQKESEFRDYQGVISKNIFNYDGVIPPALSESEKKEENLDDAPAVPSKLPLKLMGTIVHVKNELSVATIDIKSKGESLPFKVNQEIENIAKVLKIERLKVIFRNLNNNRKEYIEIEKDFKMNFGLQTPKNNSQGLDGIERVGKFDLVINKDLVEKFTKPSELPNLLKQARMKPNMGSDGSVQGFRFDWIKPGSPFSDMGFKVGDVIKGANGEEINSPRKAMEAYNALKNSSNVTLRVVRDGREEDFNYQVR